MLNRTLAVGVAFLLICQITGSVVYNQGRKVQGVVVEQASGLRSSGPPVVGARVEYLEDGDEEVQVTATDDKGRFEFPSGRRGIVTASKRGLTTISVAWPPRFGIRSELEIVLPPPTTLSGTVYDLSSQQTVLDALVAVTVKHPANLVTTGAKVEGGVFSVGGLPPGPAILLASAPGYAPHFSALTVDRKSQNVRVGMILEGQVRGSVVGADGKPVNGVRLHVEYNSGFPAGEMLVSFVGGHVVTEEGGAFSVNGIVPGEMFGLYAELDGRRSETLSLTALPGIPLEGVRLRIQ